MVRHRLSIAKVQAEKRGIKVGLLRSFGINLPLPLVERIYPENLAPSLFNRSAGRYRKAMT